MNQALCVGLIMDASLVLWKLTINREKTISWSSGNAFVSGAVGLRLKSQAGKIEHSAANGSPPLRHF